MPLDDDMDMADWQRARRAQLLDDSDTPGPFSTPSDEMPMDQWQQARSAQLAGGGMAAPAAKPSAAPLFDVDRQFLKGREATYPDMYVPVDDVTKRVLDDSGPTIATGFDLGKKNSAYLDSLPIHPDLKARLSPYLNMHGEKAADYVQAHPLRLSQLDVDAIDSAVQDRELGNLARKFNAASKVGPFNKLPRNTQTAIASLFFQYGANAPDTAAPDYWRQITTGDWDGAFKNLGHFGDKYRTRRHLEADLLAKDMQVGILPRPGR